MHYRLNHFAPSWDQNSNPIGPANIREDVILSPNGKSFTGTFALDQYDQAGNTLAHIIGQVSGTRITVDTPRAACFEGRALATNVINGSGRAVAWKVCHSAGLYRIIALININTAR